VLLAIPGEGARRVEGNAEFGPLEVAHHPGDVAKPADELAPPREAMVLQVSDNAAPQAAVFAQNQLCDLLFGRVKRQEYEFLPCDS